MRTIQEYLRECDRDSIINNYIYKYGFSYELMDRKYRDRTAGSIIDSLTDYINRLIDRLVSIYARPADKRKILLAVHTHENMDIAAELVYEDDVLNKEADQVQCYAYELSEHSEMAAFYVADTYLTQHYLTEVITEFLVEAGFTGIEQERLLEIIDKLREADIQSQEGKCYSAEEVFEKLEKELGFELEKRDPMQEAALRELHKAEYEYDKTCRRIEIEKLKELLLKDGIRNDKGRIYNTA